jgi:hypothetical protein
MNQNILTFLDENLGILKKVIFNLFVTYKNVKESPLSEGFSQQSNSIFVCQV